MNEFLIFAPMGAVLLLGVFYIRRLEDRASLRLWSWGFLCLYGSGLVSGFAGPSGWLRAVSAAFTVAFVTLTLAGALRYAGRRVSRWVVPAAVAYGGVRVVAAVTGATMGTYGIGLIFAPPVLLTTGWLIFDTARRREAPLSDLLIGPSFVALGAVHTAALYLRLTGRDTEPLIVAWVATAVAAALLQVLSVYERVRAESQQRAHDLEEERRILRTVVETSPTAMLVHDDEGRVHMVNEEAATRLGVTPGASITGGVAQRLQSLGTEQGTDPSALSTLIRSVSEDPDLVIENFDLSFEGPRPMTLQIYSSPAISETGERYGRVWIARDVTEAVQLEAQLAQSQKMDTLGTLAGGVAHDFNNQLTSILGNAQLVEEAVAESHPETADALDDLQRSAEHCAELTRGLLAFARRAPMRRSALRPADLMAETEKLLRASIPSSIALETQIDDGTWLVEADATQLQQVLINLALNARDAIGAAPGRITIRARNRVMERPESAAIPNARPGRTVQFEVTDDGAGIEAAVIERVFDPFFTTKPVGMGTGIGLAIVYGVIRSHEGWIDVESRVGQGTTVRFGMPAVTSSTLRPGVDEPAPPRGGDETLLVADDDDRVRRLTRKVLERRGYQVIEARDGLEAVETLMEHGAEIDLAVLDLTMPRMGGVDALRKMRELVPDLPCVVASGFLDGSEDVRAEAERSPAIRILPKPFSPAALCRSVRTALDNR